MIRGSCLCGVVRFEVARFVGPFEQCHCSRCRKVSGSAFAAMIGVDAADFHWVSGREEIATFEARVVEHPPGYQSAFCRHCGSPMPPPEPKADWFEIAAGALDDDPGVSPDRHIFVEFKSPWHEIMDDLPQCTKKDVIRMRIEAMKRADKDRELDSGRSEGRRT